MIAEPDQPLCAELNHRVIFRPVESPLVPAFMSIVILADHALEGQAVDRTLSISALQKRAGLLVVNRPVTAFFQADTGTFIAGQQAQLNEIITRLNSE